MIEKMAKGSYSYGKRPLWQWIVIYIVLAVVVYGLIYYVFFRHTGYVYPVQQATPTSSQTTPSSNGY